VDTPLALDPARVERRERFLVAALAVAVALLLWRAHVANVDAPARAQKLALHAQVLRNAAPDPYQYKLFAITWVVEGVHRATGVRVFALYTANELLALVALLWAHHRWLRALVGRREALLGMGVLAALAHGLFLDHYHHPYDLWGVAGFCVLARALATRARLGVLVALAFLVGLVWEKHALLPVVWLWLRRRAGPWTVRDLAGGASFGLASIAGFVATRLLLGTDRPAVDVTPLAAQAWDKVASHHGPYVLPFLAMLVFARPRIPPLVRALWIYVPVMFVAYAASRFMLYELRSFWAFAPIFTATAATWARGLADDRAAGPTAAA
jgi:hypothetical protein